MRVPRRGALWVVSPDSAIDGRLALQGKTKQELLLRYGQWCALHYAKSTRAHYERVASMFCRFLGKKNMGAVDHFDIRRFLYEALRRDLSVDAPNRYFWALRMFFDFLHLGGAIKSPPTQFVHGRRTQRKVPRVLTESEVSRLIRSTQNIRDRALIEFMYATGCRIGELVKVKIEDVNFHDRLVKLSGKGKERLAYFGSGCSRTVRRYKGKRTTGTLFLSLRAKQRGSITAYAGHWVGKWLDYSETADRPRQHHISLGSQKTVSRTHAWYKFKKRVDPRSLARPSLLKPLCTTAVSHVIRDAAQRAGLGRVTSHMIRHSFATHLLNHGANLRHIQQLLGHSWIGSTQIYTRALVREVATTYRHCHPRR